MDKEKWVRIRVDPDNHRKLKAYAAWKETSIQKIMDSLLGEFLDKIV